MGTRISERILPLAAPTSLYLCLLLYVTAGISGGSVYLMIAHITLTCVAFALAVHGIAWGTAQHSARAVTQAALALVLSGIYLLICMSILLRASNEMT
jgi:hypothetical protein